jgi:hypothetical protein
MPVNYLLIENLRRFHQFYGSGLTLECPTGSGVMMSLDQIADELCRRLIRLFVRGPDGRRPVFGNYESFKPTPISRITSFSMSISTARMAAGAVLRIDGLDVANLIDQLAVKATASGTR